MEFKYFDDYERLTSLTPKSVNCEVCGERKICFDSVFYGEEEVEHVCPQCVHQQQLYHRDIYTNQGNFALILSQIKEVFSHLTEDQQTQLATERTRELEQGTPHLVTWQDMFWPCLDGDYAKFIGFGSKALLNKLASDGNGQELFKTSLHPELQEYYDNGQWTDMLPDKSINHIDESNFNTLFYVFESLISDELVIWWDCN